MKSINRIIAAVVLIGIIVILSIMLIAVKRIDLSEYDDITRGDIVMLNDICNQAAGYFDWKIDNADNDIIFDGGKYEDYTFYVIDKNENLIFTNNSDSNISLNAALKDHEMIGDIVVDGEIVGKVILETKAEEFIKKYRRIIFLFVISYVVFVLGICIIILLYLKKRIVSPFHKLKDFSSQVARGNFDIELPKEKGEVFGSFTESFDLMRVELLESKRKEEELIRDRKELLVSLNHDVKAPIAAIKAISELLILKINKDKFNKEEVLRKLNEIDEKANHTTVLVQNILSVVMEEEEIKYDVKYYYAHSLIDLIKKADYKGYIEKIDLPDCMIQADILRLARVFDNCISNSYKYADTKIIVEGEITEDNYLCVKIRDFGKSLKKDEVEYIGVKYYRGSNATQKEGNGLGLHICSTVLEKCKGHISFHQDEEGFEVRIYLAM